MATLADTTQLDALDALDPLEVLRLYPPHDGTLAGALASRMAHDPTREFVCAGDTRLSWAEIAEATETLAGWLAARGVGPRDRVMIGALNGTAHMLLLFASARLGAIFVPVNPEFTSDELSYVLAHAEPRVALFEERIRETVEHAQAITGWDAKLVFFDPALGIGHLADGTPTPVPVADPDAPALMIYTSGTTGFPKGALHSQRSFLLAGESFVARLRLQPHDRLMVVLPLFHINALFYSLSGAIAAGAALLVTQRFSASTFWRQAEEGGATAVNVIEAIGSILCRRDRSEYRPGHRIRKAYGVRAASADTFRADFGIQHLISGYGMTEAPGVLSPPFSGPEKLGSMGVLGCHPDPAFSWAQCRVVDDAGVDVADGVTGELALRSPVLMLGYFQDAEATQAAFRDGWLLTGDLVRRDEDGYFFFVSRKKDIIRKRGENISGAELDRVIALHPGVQEAAAIPVPDQLGEDEILVVVVPEPGARIAPREIADWCAARLSAIKTPRYVVFADALPRTPTHKVAKQVLRADASLLSRATDLGQPTRIHR